jgi:hypothetical protein
MAKLKNIIKQLSDTDYQKIHDSLIEHNADKSAQLLKSMREKQMSDAKIMEELDVNTNAYYTLRSRLNQKIEEYLLQQMENPRTDILKKVANINEIVFTKKSAIAAATLKKLEKELLDYDLANELTIVYKNLKKLNLNSPDYFSYSQLYNRHVAYMLAVDKAEDILAEFFKKYGNYFLTENAGDKIALSILKDEITNISQLYKSHRLYVYQSCLHIFHRLFVEADDSQQEDEEPIEDILNNVQRIFEQYYLDSIYYHLKLVFEFLKLEYYSYYKVYRKAERYYEEVNNEASTVLTNFAQFTFPAQFLITKLQRSLRMSTQQELYEENIELFEDFESSTLDAPRHIIYVLYRAVSCYYASKYDEAARWINILLNEMSLKKYPQAFIEIKSILALQYCLLNDFDLFNQHINSIQRQVRLMGKDSCDHIIVFTKILKTSLSESSRTKGAKIKQLVERYNGIKKPAFSVGRFIKLDEDFVSRLS